MLTIKDKTFVPFITQATLENRITQLAEQINQDYKDREPLLVVVLNGAFIFAAELMKQLTIACRVTFIRVSSYHQTASTGVIREILGLHEPLEGQDLILIEDIVDTGLTLQRVCRQLGDRQPASIAVATLLFKPDALQADLSPDYVGFSIENRFVVGYGLDYDGFGRNTKEVFVLQE
ncbi:hypoxanthine phosphoribosyltransferase [Larkinella soli]|uniref:hypoxanthine phosphoribosyltransferase n=1 Tax=Larkinella soli TaxID=1770527 RepID=UPI000FFBA61A|nr:hypoxanthine phosphoribosyltransferase [Larkinella soli]